MNAPRLTYREIALFFFPLALNVQLMSISHTIINGALARLDDYVTALAGMSVAMVIHLLIASPSYQNHTVTITMARGRRSLQGVLVFITLVAIYVATLLTVIAYTPIGDLVLHKLLGTPPEVAEEAKRALHLLVILPFFTGLRGFCQGLLIRNRRTGLVSLATGVRVIALFGYLALGNWWFSGARLGAFALVGCVVSESLVIAWLAWRTRTPFKPGQTEKNIPEILRYAFPLAYSSCLQQTVPLLICAIIGRLSDGSLALAAFGVIRSFLFLLAGPMRNLQQAYLALVKNSRDQQRLIIFSLITATSMGLLVLLTAGPLNQLVIGRVLGVEQELRNYLRFALAICALFPLLYSITNLLRGWFAGADMTGRLGHSTLLKSTFLLLLWWPLANWPLPLSGVLTGILLLLGAELLEGAYLFLQRRRQPVAVRHGPPL